MKKILSAIFLLILLLIIMLALSGWYFGASAEKTLVGYLQKKPLITSKDIFNVELQDYRKTLFGAKAKLKISSDIPIIAEKIGEIDLIAKLLNGPVFVTKRGISTGVYRWFITVDKSKLTKSKKENLRAFFPNQLPHVIIRADFEKKVHYSSDFLSTFGQINLAGIFNLKQEKHHGTLKMQNFHYDFPPNQLTAKQVKLDYQGQSSQVTTIAINTPNKMAVEIPNLKIKLQHLKKPIELALKASSTIRQTNGYINGYANITTALLNRKQQENKPLPIDKANISVMLRGISTQGFLKYKALEAELNNLKLQAQWSLQENGEFPEGQDQIWQLYNEIDEKAQHLPVIIFNELLNKESLIELKAVSYNSSGQSRLTGKLKSHIEEDAEKNVKKGGDDLNTLFSNLKGEAKVEIDSELFPFLQNFLPLSKSEFKLILKDSKLLMQ